MALYGTDNGAGKLDGLGELWPVTGGKVDEFDGADLGELGGVRTALIHPLTQLAARELARDHSHRDVVAPRISERLLVGCDSRRLRHRPLTKFVAEIAVQIDKVFVPETGPVRQRYLAAVHREFISDVFTVAKRAAIYVYHAGNSVRPCVNRSVCDRPAAAVADENDRLRNGIDKGNHRPDVVSQADAFSVGIV